MKPQHPGEILRASLEKQNLSVNEAGRKVGLTGATLSRLINGKQALTAEAAIKISILCSESPLTLLTYQNLYDLARLEGGGQ
jgi:addiction module HigA family antidote